MMRVPIICASRGEAWAVKHGGVRWTVTDGMNRVWWEPEVWRCSWCGARVKVIA